MIRILSIFFVTILIAAGCKEKKEPQKSLNVSGSVKNSRATGIYLEESIISTGQIIMKDSATIAADGKFTLESQVTGESVFNLRLSNDQFPFVSLVNDTDKINVDADFSKAFDFYSVSGSDASAVIKEYLGKTGELMRQKFELEQQSDSLKKTGSSTDQVDQERKQLAEQLKTYTRQSVQQANSPSLALFILATYQGQANNPNFRMTAFESEELLGLFNELVQKFPARQDLAGIRNSIQSQIAQSIWVGKPAPEIALNDLQGKQVKLSSFRGKYVLVDFWASWCGPCRRENPNVVEAYNHFRDKNFTILGVSLDSKKENWEKAIADDGLAWTHISDLKQWESEVVPLYRITGIPFNVLVDPEGKVIAENLRGDMLQKKLGQVLN
jgi:peroxiredoxin